MDQKYITREDSIVHTKELVNWVFTNMNEKGDLNVLY